jgi:hypothetical protein
LTGSLHFLPSRPWGKRRSCPAVWKPTIADKSLAAVSIDALEKMSTRVTSRFTARRVMLGSDEQVGNGETSKVNVEIDVKTGNVAHAS